MDVFLPNVLWTAQVGIDKNEMGTGRENTKTAIALILAQDVLSICPEVKGMAKERLGESRDGNVLLQ